MRELILAMVDIISLNINRAILNHAKFVGLESVHLLHNNISMSLRSSFCICDLQMPKLIHLVR